MFKIFRDVVITSLLSFFFCAVVFEICYADDVEEVVDFESSVVEMEEDIIDFESDQSDVVPDTTGESLRDLYIKNLIILPKEDEVEEEEEEVFVYSDSSSLAQNSLPSIPRDNTVLYRGSFSGRDCWLLLPLGSTDTLITINGVLVNVGGSNITGRLFYTDELNLTSYEDTFLVLTSQFSTNLPNQVYLYQYSSYARYYYYNGSRLTYNDTYGDFLVTQQLDTSDNRPTIVTQSLITILLLFVGTSFILGFFRVAR